MATYNPNLENLTYEQILDVSEKFLMGWDDPMRDGRCFRVKGLNRRRRELGLPELTKEMSVEYRIRYVREHYSPEEIESTLAAYMADARVADERYRGIYLFDCRFGPDYAKIFRQLVGSPKFRKMAEAARVKKLVETQVEQYGGVGVAGDRAKAAMQKTVRERYGVANVMQDPDVKAKLAATNQGIYGGALPFCSQEVRDKAALSKWSDIQDWLRYTVKDAHVLSHVLKSRNEAIVYCELLDKFGTADVFYEYGIHPSDSRYPHNCDFYIKSLDLFIELNCFYTHGNHWFDPMNPDDIMRRDHLLASDSKKSHEAADVWCRVDLIKRADAKRSGIKFLVFWDGHCGPARFGGMPLLTDFYMWFRDYGCDYDRFVADHPENTY